MFCSGGRFSLSHIRILTPAMRSLWRTMISCYMDIHFIDGKMERVCDRESCDTWFHFVLIALVWKNMVRSVSMAMVIMGF